MKENELMTYWLEEIVIGLNLCPFAIKPYKENRIKIIDSKNKLEDKIFQELTKHTEAFLKNNTTDLYFFPNYDVSFESFYELFQDLEDYLEQNNLLEVQVVCFHPDFRFEGLNPDDKANFVNRSPYPCIHFLNAKEFEAIDLKPSEGEKISFLNEEKLKSLEAEEFKKLFSYLA